MSFCNNMFIFHFKLCPLTNPSFACSKININHFFSCPNSKSQQSVLRKLRLTLLEGVFRISLARMLEYCALNPRFYFSYKTSPLVASLTLSQKCQRITTVMRKGFSILHRIQKRRTLRQQIRLTLRYSLLGRHKPRFS